MRVSPFQLIKGNLDLIFDSFIQKLRNEVIKNCKKVQDLKFSDKIIEFYDKLIKIMGNQSDIKQQILHIIGNVLGGFIKAVEAVELIDELYKKKENVT